MAQIEQAAEIVDRLMPRRRCVLSYDRTLAEVAADILWELHGVREAPLPADVLRLFDLIDPEGELPRRVDALPALLQRDGEIAARLHTERVDKQASQFDHWTERRVEEDRESVITLQKDLGQGKHNSGSERYAPDRGVSRLRDYLGSVTTAPRSLTERLTRRSYWELRLRLWRLLGRVRTDLPSLSVGPRWVTEIYYFRDVLRFRRHIGLDLFSDDPKLVVAGDMHEMPLADNQFGFIFLKNVVDKSYDIRKLVSELVRVSVPGGVVIVDQICGYGYTTPITRTDIQSASNLLAVFKARARVEALVCRDIDVSGMGDAAATGARRVNARLAIRILKP